MNERLSYDGTKKTKEGEKMTDKEKWEKLRSSVEAMRGCAYDGVDVNGCRAFKDVLREMEWLDFEQKDPECFAEYGKEHQ